MPKMRTPSLRHHRPSGLAVVTLSGIGDMGVFERANVERLVSMIDRLIGACEGFLNKRGIEAPLMVVRGDGALIAAAEARLRPIETILSGPAASLVGARHLTGLSQAVVSDIGGTTTDIGMLVGGFPRSRITALVFH